MCSACRSVTQRQLSPNSVKLFPKGFSLAAYKMIFGSGDIWRSYYNTIIYTVGGTAISVTLTLLGCLSAVAQAVFFAKAAFDFLFVSMFFTGTLVPMYLLINQLGLYNTRWAIILPTGAAAYYIVMARTFLSTIPRACTSQPRLMGQMSLRFCVAFLSLCLCPSWRFLFCIMPYSSGTATSTLWCICPTSLCNHCSCI